MSGEWFDDAFDDLYTELYGHRDEAEAEQAVAWVEGALAARGERGLAGRACVDLACGAGRHLVALARRGARATGVDRSPALLARARAVRDAGGGFELVRGDLRRLPLGSGRFQLALSMFTSLGYFATEAENRTALSEVARVLHPRGWFVLDYLNADQVTRSLVPRSVRALGDYLVEEERAIDTETNRVRKEVCVRRRASGEVVKHYAESVALWDRAGLEARLGAAGFRVRALAGDYEGRAWEPDAPRVLVLGEHVGGRQRTGA